MSQNWDKEVDVLVVGSGAGGLLTALVASKNNADVLIVEKDKLWGGTSATSGGGIWIPGSDLARAAGFEDNLDEAFTYLRALSADNVPDANIQAYVDNAAPMLRWVTDNTQVQYDAVPYPDYHAENPGGSTRGFRTHLPRTFDGKQLGADIRTQRFPSPAASLFGFLQWTFAETNELLYRSKGWFTHLTINMARYWLDLPFRFTSGKDRRLTLGNSLTGGLRLALNERNVPLWLESPLTELVRDGDKVTGAVITHNGKPMRIGVRKGVVLAAGGFDRNQAMRDENAPLYPTAKISGGVTSNTGDSIRAGQAIGAKTMNMQSTWAAPVFYIPGEDRGRLCTIERALPGCIMVNQKGERYLNEAASYHVTGQLMAKREHEHGDASPSWMVFDYRYRHQFPMGPLYPLIPDWAQRGDVKLVLKKAKTIEELAEQMGVDPTRLSATIAHFNEHAAKGEDPDFHRGEAAYDKMYGDQRNQPNPCLRPLTDAPFYAMPVYPGDIGTNGGLLTNAKAQVIGDNGQPIQGLYAVGNNAASAMGESYPGAGVTLGPAMTFGYIAARDMTGGNE
ncbi:3-ketosteroid delta(1)-dehydrogenase [Caenibius tardaugens NBRC 16725]|uniref:3-ketosteroid delta(1)-dehydrogenase n=1 Tax=Caenibius tardaugens NBRC 16725 TaxID=1219035 RepID=U2ZVX9_9SPHN|nr:FAD-dependent oxidoreductase [Caenibius tardaugens]AZI36848.1 FAD-dependent oxidoreductase [Caenibius tardaugens NBRC 16725]TXG98539.1 MAG: FAD-dependent oxidoreductase [Rhodocyclaceae bacterium]GAD49529.1 3-ketosteroid delta(1)-dehydrogenase [Caenibius tardaugens NBRC 16725]